MQRFLGVLLAVAAFLVSATVVGTCTRTVTRELFSSQQQAPELALAAGSWSRVGPDADGSVGLATLSHDGSARLAVLCFKGAPQFNVRFPEKIGVEGVLVSASVQVGHADAREELWYIPQDPTFLASLFPVADVERISRQKSLSLTLQSESGRNLSATFDTTGLSGSLDMVSWPCGAPLAGEAGGWEAARLGRLFLKLEEGAPVASKEGRAIFLRAEETPIVLHLACLGGSLDFGVRWAGRKGEGEGYRKDVTLWFGPEETRHESWWLLPSGAGLSSLSPGSTARRLVGRDTFTMEWQDEGGKTFAATFHTSGSERAMDPVMEMCGYPSDIEIGNWESVYIDEKVANLLSTYAGDDTGSQGVKGGRAAFLPATEGAALLYVLFIGGETQFLVSQGEEVAPVGEWLKAEIWIGGGEAKEEVWEVGSADIRAVDASVGDGVYSLTAIPTLREVANGDRFIIRYTTAKGKILTNVFDTKGMAAALKPIMQEGGWSLEPETTSKWDARALEDGGKAISLHASDNAALLTAECSEGEIFTYVGFPDFAWQPEDWHGVLTWFEDEDAVDSEWRFWEDSAGVSSDDPIGTLRQMVKNEQFVVALEDEEGEYRFSSFDTSGLEAVLLPLLEACDLSIDNEIYSWSEGDFEGSGVGVSLTASGSDARFIAQCWENNLWVIVNWDEAVARPGSWQSVKTRSGGGSESENSWEVASEGNRIFSPSPVHTLRRVVENDRFSVEIAGGEGEEISESFNTTGLRAALKPVEAACGWSLGD